MFSHAKVHPLSDKQIPKKYPLMLDGLNKNRAAVQNTSPGRLEVAFSNTLARFTSPCFAQIFKSAKDPKPQQDFQRSSAPNLAST